MIIEKLHQPEGRSLRSGDRVGKELWEKIWRKGALEGYIGLERYMAINKKLDKLFKRFLVKGDKKILEIGCAKAKHLIYFAREFGYEIYGIDYSESGIEIANENLKIAGIQGTILCEDAFKTSFKSESFNVVYSMGLIEHFENPKGIINVHINLLKKGGKLIITVPNFRNSLYLILSMFLRKDKEILETHNLSIMNKEKLKELMLNQELKVLFLDYFGPINLMLVPVDIKAKPILYLMHLVNQVIGYATFFMPLPRYLCPYLVLIAEKIGTNRS